MDEVTGKVVDKTKRKRWIALVVLVAAAAIGWDYFRHAQIQYQEQIFGLNDTFAAVQCFVVKHHGVMPSSLIELANDGLVKVQNDGSYVVQRESANCGHGKVYGFRITQSSGISIDWGCDLRTASIVDGRVISPDGRELTPISSSFSPNASRQFSMALVKDAQGYSRDRL